jgi:3-oxoacyl-(acyl-carrier-protein) synthase
VKIIRDNQVVVTGLAAISAAGVGTAALLEALGDKESRLRPVPESILGVPGHKWGKAESFRAADFMPPMKARKFDRCSLFAVAAAGMALKDAVIEPVRLDPTRIGIVLGCGFGGIANSEEFLRGFFRSGAEGMIPMLFPNTVPNAPASNASIEHNLQGPNVTLIQRFCSAETALLMAQRFLEEDRADIILTGGVDELTPVMLQGFRATGQLRGFGGGFGEGAGMLVLERSRHALQRGAHIKATLGQVRTIGRLLPDDGGEGASRLLPAGLPVSLISLSGSAVTEKRLVERLPYAELLETGPLLGRSLAMGGLAMTALVLGLKDGDKGLHLAASPEGPYFAIDFKGGAPVQS